MQLGCCSRYGWKAGKERKWLYWVGKAGVGDYSGKTLETEKIERQGNCISSFICVNSFWKLKEHTPLNFETP